MKPKQTPILNGRRLVGLPRWVVGCLVILLGLMNYGIKVALAPTITHAEPCKTTQKEELTTNPFAGDLKSIEEGRILYRSTCVICHGKRGGRGPNLYTTQLNDQSFMDIVMNGRKGTQMPPWKGKLSEEEVWKILTYLRASKP